MQHDPPASQGDIQYHAPFKLKRLQEWLQNVTLSSQPEQTFDADKWLKEIQLAEIKVILERHPRAIKRIDIVALAGEAGENPAPASIRRVFLATMLWGYTNVGYGPWRVARMLGNLAQLDRVLSEAHKAIRSSNIRQAYTSLQDAHIPYFGPAFFTKFLYFAGLGCGVDHFPLILDSRVMLSLQELLGANAPALGELDDYLQYVACLHEWAELLDCRADSIEYLLFLTPKEFWQV
jgi:hypothetical protein